MTHFVSVTSQGQISIPAAIRRKIGLDRVKKATVSLDGNSIVVTPVKEIEDLMGSLKTNKRFTRAQERKAFEEGIVKEFT